MIKNAVAVLQNISNLEITETGTDAADLTASFSLTAGGLHVTPFACHRDVTATLVCEPFHVEVEMNVPITMRAKPFSGYQLDLELLRTPFQEINNNAVFVDDDDISFYGTGSFFSGDTGVDSLLINKIKPQFFEVTPVEEGVTPTYGQGTVEFWYRPTRYPSYEEKIWDVHNFGTEVAILEQINGSIYLRAYIGSTLTTVAVPLRQNGWNHIAFTVREAKYVDLYVNGEHRDTLGNGTDLATFSYDPDSKFRLGYGSRDGYYNGLHISKNIRYSGKSYYMPRAGHTVDSDTFYHATLETYQPEQSFFTPGKTLTFNTTYDFFTGTENNKLSSELQSVFEFDSTPPITISSVTYDSDTKEIDITFSEDITEIAGGSVHLYYLSDDEYIEQVEMATTVTSTNSITITHAEDIAFGHLVYIGSDAGTVKNLNFYAEPETSKSFTLEKREYVNSLFSMDTIFHKLTNFADPQQLDAVASITPNVNATFRPLSQELPVVISLGAAPTGTFISGADMTATFSVAAEGIYVIGMPGYFTMDAAATYNLGGLAADLTIPITMSTSATYNLGGLAADVSATSTATSTATRVRSTPADITSTSTLTCNTVNTMDLRVGFGYWTADRTFGMNFTNFAAGTVDWGDGSPIEIITSSMSHTYPSDASYDIRIETEVDNVAPTGRAFEISDGEPALLNITDWKTMAINSFASAFRDCNNINSIPNNLPGQLTNMESAFFNAFGDTFPYNPTPIEDWDVSRITNFNSTFRSTPVSVDLTGWDLSSCVDAGYMFAFCNGVINLNSVGFGTNADLEGMFYGGGALPIISTMDVSNVQNMRFMFYNSAFTSDITGWNTANVTDMSYMFSGTTAFNQDISGWNTSSVTTMSNMFKNSEVFNQSLSALDVSSVISFSSMFDGSIYNSSLAGWTTSSARNFLQTFRNCPFNQSISHFDMAEVTDLRFMFEGNTAFHQDLSGWTLTVLNETDGMFKGATNFNGDISSWDVSSVTSMSEMFEDATSLDQDLSGWNMTGVTDTSWMFNRAIGFTSDLSSWDMSDVTDATGMFASKGSINSSLKMTGWSFGTDADLSQMFYQCTVDSIDSGIDGWDVSNVKTFSHMFNGAFFSLGSLSSWTTTSAQLMNNMFENSWFNGNINGWNVSGVVSIAYMFKNSGFTQDIGSWNIGNVTNMSYFMQDNTSFNQDLSGWDTSSILFNTGYDSGATAWQTANKPTF